MFEVNGSIDSLLPRIWAVDAVGIGARRSELRRPCAAILALSAAQSHRALGATPHRSYCSSPREAGEPSYDE